MGSQYTGKTAINSDDFGVSVQMRIDEMTSVLMTQEALQDIEPHGGIDTPLEQFKANKKKILEMIRQKIMNGLTGMRIRSNDPKSLQS